jgi:ADP-ribose pyrophosphatase YjhB (NUDIX family)/GNAT superfamily N-acetyltransferase
LIKTPRGFLFERLKAGYYVPVGGRVTLGETSQEAARRETLEECGIVLDELRERALLENFFTEGKRRFHEYNFVYASEYNFDVPLPEGFYAFTPEELGAVELRPKIMRELILSGEPCHLIIQPPPEDDAAAISGPVPSAVSGPAAPCEVHAASEPEVDALLGIWKEKSRELTAKGRPLWSEAQFSREALRDKYVYPRYYAAVAGDEVVGGFILINNDLRYWPEYKDDRALYFHKFAVKSGHGGKGYSHCMLEWVKDRARAAGKDWVRLDFNEERTYLRDLYYSHGFKPVSRVHGPDGRPITKAECPLR